MREIEFRGKVRNYNEWIYGSLVHITETYKGEEDTQDCDIYQIVNYDGVAFYINPETVGQYTGLKDKNGKKIYEGDIVKAFYFETEVIGKIEFIYGTFALTNSDISDNQLFIFEKLEVIGNIYDTPELLKEEL